MNLPTISRPNTEQIKSSVRWLITTFGAGTAGWFAAKGYFSVQDGLALLNSPAFLSASVAVIGWILGLFDHTEKKQVAAVDALAKEPNSPVQGVVTAPTPEGKALADAMPGNTTAPAGTQAAAEIANNVTVKGP